MQRSRHFTFMTFYSGKSTSEPRLAEKCLNRVPSARLASVGEFIGICTKQNQAGEYGVLAQWVGLVFHSGRLQSLRRVRALLVDWRICRPIFRRRGDILQNRTSCPPGRIDLPRLISPGQGEYKAKYDRLVLVERRDASKKSLTQLL